MSNDPEFKMSQDYELIPPQKKRAYPILIEEWEHIKEKINSIKDEANLYHTIGSVLLGVAGSALVAALTINIPTLENEQMPMTIVIAWFIFSSALISGCLSLHFGKSQRKVQSSNKNDVIGHMKLIEKRYEAET
jgi:hypothetical protein